MNGKLSPCESSDEEQIKPSASQLKKRKRASSSAPESDSENPEGMMFTRA